MGEVYYIPTGRRITIYLSPHEGGWKSVFWWNQGELDSEDYEIPLVGFGSTTKEAIGDLVEKYDRAKRNPTEHPA